MRIDWSNTTPNSTITFEPAVVAKKDKLKNNNPFVLAFDDLRDGEFVITTNQGAKKVPFRKENWTQLACLNLPKPVSSSEGEVRALSSYFRLVEESLEERKQLERKHELHVDSLKRKIDDLEREIDRLNGIPESFEPIHPELEIEHPVEEVIFFVEEDASPMGGNEAFVNNLKSMLGDMTTKFSGNITIEIIVQKNGRIRTEVLQAAEDKSDVVARLRHKLDKQTWIPATSRGRSFETSTVLSINIGASK
ncbi:MAG: hypothetical protein P8P74_05420 [Crocinitomicaceae bacterium]|nr:hypothetical protein [Crocinitomicaceae bacterium]